MELHQLEYLVAVVDEGGFTAAASSLHVAQSGVSAQVRKLERELGQTLLDRSARTVRPTAVGEAVLPHARAVLAAVAAVGSVVDELSGLMRGQVTVGTVASISSEAIDLSGALAEFHERHPAVEISLSESTSDRLLEALGDGSLDLALVGLATPPPAGIETQAILDEPLVAAVGHDDPLAAQTTITLEVLHAHRLISLPRGTGLRTAIDNACAAAGLQPRIAFEASDPRVLAQLASRGLGAAILPRAAAVADERLHALAITRPRLRGRIELAWRAQGPTSPAASAFIAHARSRLAPVAAKAAHDR